MFNLQMNIMCVLVVIALPLSFCHGLNFSDNEEINLSKEYCPMSLLRDKLPRPPVHSLSPQQGPGILICIICQEVLDDPRRIDCGHTFCNLCITQWLCKSICCPMCRQKVSKEGMSKDLIAFNIINDLEVTCSNSGIY